MTAIWCFAILVPRYMGLGAASGVNEDNGDDKVVNEVSDDNSVNVACRLWEGHVRHVRAAATEPAPDLPLRLGGQARGGIHLDT